MTTEQVQELLRKYFDGDSSLEEEAALRRYFQQEEVPVALKAYQPLFRFFAEARQETLSEGFEKRLIQAIQEDPPQARVHTLGFYALRLAAAVALLVGLLFWMPRLGTQHDPAVAKWAQYEPETPEEAYQATQEALQLLASKLNRGAGKAANEIQKIQPIKEVFK